VWLEVKDARAAAAALRQRGASILGQPMEIVTGWAVEVADPWGNVLGLTDYVKQPSRGRQA
jgi:predicted enzyme related to lactoylglutathione lyase